MMRHSPLSAIPSSMNDPAAALSKNVLPMYESFTIHTMSIGLSDDDDNEDDDDDDDEEATDDDNSAYTNSNAMPPFPMTAMRDAFDKRDSK